MVTREMRIGVNKDSAHWPGETMVVQETGFNVCNIRVPHNSLHPKGRAEKGPGEVGELFWAIEIYWI
jgi:hypothetical protein